MVKVAWRQLEALKVKKNRCWQVNGALSIGKNELFIVFRRNFGAYIGKGMHKKNAEQREIWVPTERLFCSSKRISNCNSHLIENTQQAVNLIAYPNAL
jgi:hypothetical protein